MAEETVNEGARQPPPEPFISFGRELAARGARSCVERSAGDSGLHPNFGLLTYCIIISSIYWYVHGIHIRQVPRHEPKRYFCAVARSVTGAIRNACAIDPES